MADIDSVGAAPLSVSQVQYQPPQPPTLGGAAPEPVAPSSVARQLQTDSFEPGQARPGSRWYDANDRFEPTGPAANGQQTLTGQEAINAAYRQRQLAERELRTDGQFVGPNGVSANRETAGTFRPAGGRVVSDQPIYFSNGINTTAAEHARAAQALADRTRRPVIAVHNATEGAAADLAQCARQKTGEETAPTRTLTREINAALERGERFELYAHSQGALDASNAINAVRDGMRARGVPEAEIQRRLGNISVQTFGGASVTYPRGPHYVHNVNERDGVAASFGWGSSGIGTPNPDPNTVINRQRHEGDAHAFMSYLGWAIPQAR